MVEFSFNLGVAFTLNYIVGTGFLTIPWAFVRVGASLSVLSLIILGTFAVASANFILESMAHASTLFYLTAPTEHSDASNLSKFHVFELVELCDIFFGRIGKVLYTVAIMLLLYGNLTVLSSVFGHSIAAFCDPNADEADPDSDRNSYFWSLVAFSFIVIPLSCRDLTEQVRFQSILAGCRILMLILMLLTVGLSYHCDCSTFSNYPELPQENEYSIFDTFKYNNLCIMLPIAAYSIMFHHSIPALSNPVKDKTQLGNIFTVTLIICVISYIVLGLVVGGYFGPYMQSAANLNWQSYTGGVEWFEYDMEGEQNGDDDAQVPSRMFIMTKVLLVALAACCRWFIVIFPALDVISAFPLIAITLGSSLLATFMTKVNPTEGPKPDDDPSWLHPPVARTGCTPPPPANPDYSTPTQSYVYNPVVAKWDPAEIRSDDVAAYDHEAEIVEPLEPVEPPVREVPAQPRINVNGEYPKNSRVMFRFLACLPPIILAAYCRSVNTVTEYAGACGFVVCFTIPAALALSSRHRLRSLGLPVSTVYYDGWLTSDAFAWATLLLGLALVVYVPTSFLLA